MWRRVHIVVLLLFSCQMPVIFVGGHDETFQRICWIAKQVEARRNVLQSWYIPLLLNTLESCTDPGWPVVILSILRLLSHTVCACKAGTPLRQMYGSRCGPDLPIIGICVPSTHLITPENFSDVLVIACRAVMSVDNTIFCTTNWSRASATLVTPMTSVNIHETSAFPASHESLHHH